MLVQPFFEARAEMFGSFLKEWKTTQFPFEIFWPLLSKPCFRSSPLTIFLARNFLAVRIFVLQWIHFAWIRLRSAHWCVFFTILKRLFQQTRNLHSFLKNSSWLYELICLYFLEILGEKYDLTLKYLGQLHEKCRVFCNPAFLA